MKSFFRNEYLLVALIVINMIVGIRTFRDYGESFDEARSFEYGAQSINAYHALLNPKITIDFGVDILRFYGPAYLMIASLLSKGFQGLFPKLSVIDLWHINNFLCFQFGLICFYFTVCRFANKDVAILTAALFSSQPLIWGHSFINPKDIPLLAFFTATVLFGLKMLDAFEKHNFSIKKVLGVPQFYIAGILLGITMSIRILGLLAGLIVLFYLAFINSKKVLRFSYAYFGIAFIVTFLTWPYLWESPIINLLTSISVALKFTWPGYVLFDGSFYQVDKLPRAYFPQLLMMQLTETALGLFLVGLTVLCLPTYRETRNKLIPLIILWLVFPGVYFFTFGIKLYDNLRHLLFIYPAIFLIIAVGLKPILHLGNKPWLKTLITILVLYPGVQGIIQHHPFEYTYYNNISRSVHKIFRNYDEDYWATSYKQAAAWLNENAPQNARVIVWGPDNIVQRCVRKDIQIQNLDIDYNFQNICQKSLVEIGDLAPEPYYVVLPSRWNVDLHVLPEVSPIYSVERGDSILCVIKHIDLRNLEVQDEN